MSTLSHDIRIQAFHEIGVRIDDALEETHQETVRREGAHGALLVAIQGISEVQKSLRSETFQDTQQAAVAASWVLRCARVCEALVSQASGRAKAAQGAEDFAKRMVAMVKQMHDLGVAQKQRETEPLAPTPVDGILVRPIRRRTIREERLAEAAAAAVAVVAAPIPVKAVAAPKKKRYTPEVAPKKVAPKKK